MPIHSRFQTSIPSCSVPTLLFGSPTASLPSTAAFLDADRADTHFFTCETLRLWAQRIAAGLVRAGLQPGDRVLLISSNTVFFPVFFMGVIMAGGVFTGANSNSVARELAHQLSDSGAKFLFCIDAALPVGLEAAAKAGLPQSHVFLFDEELFEGTGRGRLGVRNWKELVASEEVGRRFHWLEPKDPKNASCCLNYSSGTTGLPKGVEITHYSVSASIVMSEYMINLHPAAALMKTHERWLSFMPMYHAAAQMAQIFFAINLRIPVYIMKKYELVKALENIQKHKITTFSMAPPVVVQLTKSPLTKNYDLSSIQALGCGTAPLQGSIISQCEGLWPGKNLSLRQGWGMTELTLTTLGWDPRLPNVSGSVGELLPNCSAKIMDPNGDTEVAKGQRGELWVKGPSLMKGYWHNPTATQETFIDHPDGRWLRTGDIAYVNPDNMFFVVDRLKELIKVKGFQVAPAELEALLLEHDDIADAGVVGVEIQGVESPRAYVVKKQGGRAAALGEKDVQLWVEKRVNRSKRLTGGVVFVDEVPKNPSGKILRKLLKERARMEIGDRVQAKL